MSSCLGPPRESMCRLCWEEVPLRNSHILPAFVFRDLKKNGVTGHIRFSETPNKRVQDGLKLPWLCDVCEQRFSAWERKFANEVVAPWSDGRNITRYSEWLLKFCVSVSWRTLMYAKGRNSDATYTPESEALITRAELTWREFLLGKRPHPSQFEQHLMIWETSSSTTIPNLPPNFNRFIMNSIMLDVVGSASSTYAWSKLGRFQIFGTISHGPHKWEGTKVRVRHGTLQAGRFVVPDGLLDLYREKAKIASDASAAISDAQFEKIDADVRRNLERVATSRSFEAMVADAEMFGLESIIRRPKRT